MDSQKSNQLIDSPPLNFVYLKEDKEHFCLSFLVPVSLNIGKVEQISKKKR